MVLNTLVGCERGYILVPLEEHRWRCTLSLHVGLNFDLASGTGQVESIKADAGLSPGNFLVSNAILASQFRGDCFN